MMMFAAASATLLLCYLCVAGTFPFNSFLSAFLSCVGTCVLTACLRMQVNPQNKDFEDVR